MLQRFVYFCEMRLKWRIKGECQQVDAALKKAIAAAKAKGFDPEVELPPQQYAAHMRRWSQGTLGQTWQQ